MASLTSLENQRHYWGEHDPYHDTLHMDDWTLGFQEKEPLRPEKKELQDIFLRPDKRDYYAIYKSARCYHNRESSPFQVTLLGKILDAERDEKTIPLNLRNGEKIDLPKALTSILESIEKSRYLLKLEPNWDDDGSPAYDYQTWKKSVQFVAKYSSLIYNTFRLQKNGRRSFGMTFGTFCHVRQ